MTSEGVLVTKWIKRLQGMDGVWARKVHGSPYTRGEPDIDAVVSGMAVKLEAKLPGLKATPRQESALRRWERAGAIIGVVHSWEEVAEKVHEAQERANKLRSE